MHNDLLLTTQVSASSPYVLNVANSKKRIMLVQENLMQ